MTAVVTPDMHLWLPGCSLSGKRNVWSPRVQCGLISSWTFQGSNIVAVNDYKFANNFLGWLLALYTTYCARAVTSLNLPRHKTEQAIDTMLVHDIGSIQSILEPETGPNHRTPIWHRRETNHKTSDKDIGSSSFHFGHIRYRRRESRKWEIGDLISRVPAQPLETNTRMLRDFGRIRSVLYETT
jgi:hypothetical protein